MNPLPLPEEREDRTVVIIGRGHSGTRAIAGLLRASGVWLKEPVNGTMDSTDPRLYHTARAAGIRTVTTSYGDQHTAPEFDFSEHVNDPIPERFEENLRAFVAEMYGQRPGYRGWFGWKLPETVLFYPWVVRLFPRFRFLVWTRDPICNILKPHGTDDLREWGVDLRPPVSNLDGRALSYLYQDAIVRETPEPERFLRIRFEDWADDQQAVLDQLREFLPGLAPQPIHVDPDPVRRWRMQQHDVAKSVVDLLRPAIRRHRG